MYFLCFPFAGLKCFLCYFGFSDRESIFTYAYPLNISVESEYLLSAGIFFLGFGWCFGVLMAGKSNKGKNRKGSQSASATNSSEPAVNSDASLNNHSTSSDANGVPASCESTANSEVPNAATEDKVQGDTNTNEVEKPKQDEAQAMAEHKAKQGKICYTSLICYIVMINATLRLISNVTFGSIEVPY